MVEDDFSKALATGFAPVDGFRPSDEGKVVDAEQEQFPRGIRGDGVRIGMNADGIGFDGLGVPVKKDDWHFPEITLHQGVGGDPAFGNAAGWLPEVKQAGDSRDGVVPLQTIAIGCRAHVFDGLDAPLAGSRVIEHAVVFQTVGTAE